MEKPEDLVSCYRIKVSTSYKTDDLNIISGIASKAKATEHIEIDHKSADYIKISTVMTRKNINLIYAIINELDANQKIDGINEITKEGNILKTYSGPEEFINENFK